MKTITLDLLPGERWWGGTVKDGVHMPYSADSRHARDLAVPLNPSQEEAAEDSNQAAPLLLSTAGRVVASRRPFAFEFADGTLSVTGTDLSSFVAGDNLRQAFLAASAGFFPPSGKTPARALLAHPQYNTWIETPMVPSEESVLAYAERILDAGLPPGVMFIDDNWAPDYGTLRFDPIRFPDPARFLARLQELGFPVMLLLVPFISPDSPAFRECEAAGLLVRGADGRTAVRRWWNGLSALLDLSNPQAVKWLTDQLDALRALGVAGFKFDGGDVRDYRSDDQIAHPCQPVDMCENWARLGLRYQFNEFRACWQMGGQPLGQRLRDKPPRWDGDGLASLIPEMLAQGLMGHAFVCPDMVGGGLDGEMSKLTSTNQEFFVRYAQLAALSPMIQFSVNPARELDVEHLAAVREALALREAHLPTIMTLAEAAATTGEPIIRPLSYHYEGYEQVVDQFLLGPDLLVAPVLEPGATTRTVQVPPGRWQAPDGGQHTGPTELTYPVTLTTVPHLLRLPGSSAS